MGGITSYCGFINRVDIFKLATINSFKSWMIFQVFGIEQGPIMVSAQFNFFFFLPVWLLFLCPTLVTRRKTSFLITSSIVWRHYQTLKKNYPSFNWKYFNHESQLAECHCLVKWNNYLKVRVKNILYLLSGIFVAP